MNENNHSLIKGPIYPALVKLALPIMGTSFLQMAYNLTDLLWIGRIGSQAVAAVGTAGFYLWFGFAFILMTKVGAEVRVAQSIGSGEREKALVYGRNAIGMTLLFAFFYSMVLFIFNRSLIAFFNINDPVVVTGGMDYLKIVAYGIPSMFLINVTTGIFNGYGDSKTPFLITAVGLVFNMILDPLMIFGIGPFPALGIKGAAYATVVSMIIVVLVYICYIGVKKRTLQIKRINRKTETRYYCRNLKIRITRSASFGSFYNIFDDHCKNHS